MGGIMGKLGLNGFPHLYGFHGIGTGIAQISAQRFITDKLNRRMVNRLYKIIRHLTVQFHTGPLSDHGFLKHDMIKKQIHNAVGNKQDGQHGRRSDIEDFFSNSHRYLPV